MKFFPAAATLATVLLALPALAEDRPNDRFRSLDRNGDGFITKDEVRGIRGYDKAFDQADENRDGRLDPDEFVKAESLHQGARLGEFVGDSMLTAKVKTALLRERNLKSTDIHVETDNARVLLSGFVDSDEEKNRAVRVARTVEGVREVMDGLAVR